MEDDATRLVIQLEDNLGELRNGIPLIGVLMADKLPNRGAVEGILRKAWEPFGEVKISVVKDNLFAITVESEDMAGRILERGPWAVMGYAFSTHPWEEGMAICHNFFFKKLKYSRGLFKRIAARLYCLLKKFK
ncbi:unnamed protein product [Prunus armeniaca]